MTNPHPGRPNSSLVNAGFGALAGLPLGAAAGAACCWQMGLWDEFWQGVRFGMLAGPIAGALIGYLQGRLRAELVRPQVATFAGIGFGLLTAVLIGYMFFAGRITGRFSLLTLAGVTFTSPMIGLMIGGVLDRAFEEVLRKRWGVAAATGVVGLAISGGVIWLIDSSAYGPEPAEIGRLASAAILEDWSDNPELRGAEIQEVSIVRLGRRAYTGFIVLRVADEEVRFVVAASLQDEGVRLKCTPVNEGPREPGPMRLASVQHA